MDLSACILHPHLGRHRREAVQLLRAVISEISGRIYRTGQESAGNTGQRKFQSDSDMNLHHKLVLTHSKGERYSCPIFALIDEVVVCAPSFCIKSQNSGFSRVL